MHTVGLILKEKGLYLSLMWFILQLGLREYKRMAGRGMTSLQGVINSKFQKNSKIIRLNYKNTHPGIDSTESRRIILRSNRSLDLQGNRIKSHHPWEKITLIWAYYGKVRNFCISVPLMNPRFGLNSRFEHTR